MEQVIGESVKKTNQTFLRRYVDDYCKALDENFKQDTAVFERNTNKYTPLKKIYNDFYQQDILPYHTDENLDISLTLSNILKDIVGRQYDLIKLKNGKIIHGEMINYLVKGVTLKEVPSGFVHQFVQESYSDFSLHLAGPNIPLNQQQKFKKELIHGFSQFLEIIRNLHIIPPEIILGIFFRRRLEGFGKAIQ